VEEADGVALLGDLLPFVHKMLRKHRTFLPFGARMGSDGVIAWEGAYDGDEATPRQLIDMVHESHLAMAARQEIRACAVAYDIRTIPRGRSRKQDAICVTLDHATGFSVRCIYPYKLSLFGKLVIEDEYAVQGNADIFPQG
jgi:hypothetical protein